MSSDSSTPLYFWRETEPDGGYLSQWYMSMFVHKCDTYVSAEMWMMAGKARLFDDKAILEQIMKEKRPRKHKGLGQKVQPWDQDVWERERFDIVVQGNMLKFTSGKERPELRRRLLETGDRELVEASPFDRVWGIGFKAEHADQNRSAWGENLLGKALMEVRRRLREEGEKEEMEAKDKDPLPTGVSGEEVSAVEETVSTA
ncbi:DUF1768-domain-containing protein [Pseudovirgaria hyperparasitica]|uniref:DUF1768-domain-containing protein n=1 Tax=Pseudovirgaria hyperparasitica TaxID=470096 RepID=A0A6A6WE83_9PEZI|nr:DUF1768-domain-containing protein [Pseudovirgaria hyperparasitica]KAF2761023.1 DUF1768-domain-containing protein [Pseudovirgaria hyperparasitica]